MEEKELLKRIIANQAVIYRKLLQLESPNDTISLTTALRKLNEAVENQLPTL